MTARAVYSPSGSSGEIQFVNSSGIFDATNVFWNSSTSVLSTPGKLVVTGGLSGSITHLVDGTSYLIGGTNVTISTGSAGAVTISSAGGAGGSDCGSSGLDTGENVIIWSSYRAQKSYRMS